MKQINRNPVTWLPPGLLLLVMLSSGCAAMASRPTETTVKNDVQQAASEEASADAALRAGNENKALMGYVAALQLDPENAGIRYKIGQIHMRREDYPAAAQAFGDVLRTQPRHAGSLEGMGLILLKNRKLDQAGDHLQRSVALDGQRWRAYNGLGVIADLRRTPDTARTYYQKALALQPEVSMLHNNLGYSRYLAGDYRMAVLHFERALAADPDNRTAWANLALARVRLGDEQGGVTAFVEIMEPYRAHNNVGYLLYMSGQSDKARAHLEQAIELSPSYYALAQQNLERVGVAQTGK